MRGLQARSVEHTADMVLTVGIAQRRQKLYAAAVMGLDRESQQAVRR